VTQSPFEPPSEPTLPSEQPAPEDRPAAGALSPSRALTFDEMIALFVAFLSLGSVLFWGLTRGGMTLLSDVPENANAAIATPQNSTRDGLFGLAQGTPDNADDNAEAANAAAPIENADANEAKSADKKMTAVETARRDLAVQAQTNRSPSRNLGAAIRTGVVGATAGITGATTAPESAAAPLPPVAADSSTIPLSAAATATPKDSIRFDDVPDNYWAKPYIDALSSRDLISGFEDGDFKPDQSVTRAQIANIVSRTFDLTTDQKSLQFSDVEGGYWARESIDEVVKGGFMTGFPNNTFSPNAPVTRAQALTTLVTGLGLQPPTNKQAALSRYTDATKIPTWATDKVAAATAGNLVVNYPNLQQLNPDQPTTRAELSAMIYQALAKEGVVEPVASEYVVKP
jgi:S-layer homology domain